MIVTSNKMKVCSVHKEKSYLLGDVIDKNDNRLYVEFMKCIDSDVEVKEVFPYRYNDGTIFDYYIKVDDKEEYFYFFLQVN